VQMSHLYLGICVYPDMEQHMQMSHLYLLLVEV
jgi:hypothetical protein